MQMLQTQHSTVPRSYGTRMPVLSTHVTLERHFFLYLALKSTQLSSDTYVHDTSVTSPVVLQGGMFSPCHKPVLYILLCYLWKRLKALDSFAFIRSLENIKPRNLALPSSKVVTIRTLSKKCINEFVSFKERTVFICITEIKQFVSVIDMQCTFHQLEKHLPKYCLDLTARIKTVSSPDPKSNLTSLTAICHILRRYLCRFFNEKKTCKGVNHSCI